MSVLSISPAQGKRPFLPRASIILCPTLELKIASCMKACWERCVLNTGILPLIYTRVSGYVVV